MLQWEHWYRPMINKVYFSPVCVLCPVEIGGGMPREELCNGLRRYVVALKYVQLKQIGTIPVVSIQRDKKLKHSIHHITYLAHSSGPRF